MFAETLRHEKSESLSSLFLVRLLSENVETWWATNLGPAMDAKFNSDLVGQYVQLQGTQVESQPYGL
jgi:hypothetical protein